MELDLPRQSVANLRRDVFRRHQTEGNGARGGDGSVDARVVVVQVSVGSLMKAADEVRQLEAVDVPLAPIGEA